MLSGTNNIVSISFSFLDKTKCQFLVLYPKYVGCIKATLFETKGTLHYTMSQCGMILYLAAWIFHLPTFWRVCQPHRAQIIGLAQTSDSSIKCI